MKKLLQTLVLTAAVLLPLASRAQATPRTVLVGDSTSTTTGYYVPVNTYFNYSIMEMIIDASEMGGAMDITSISFHYATANTMTKATNVMIYMKTVSRSTFSSNTDTESLEGAELVYSGALNCTQGWNTFTLDDTYSYDGTDNLMVIVHDNLTGYDGSAYKFTYTSCTGYKTLSWYSDTYNPYNTSTQAFNTSASKDYYQYRPVTKLGGTEPAPVTCPKPQVAIGNVAYNSVAMSWDTTGYAGATYSIAYTAGGVAHYTTTTGTGITITGLTAETSYTFDVRRICSATDSSAARTVNTTTMYHPISLPYTNGFEASEIAAYNGSTTYQMPINWKRYNNATSTTYMNYPYSYSSSTYAHTGSRVLYCYRGTGTATYGDTALAILPMVDTALFPMNNNEIVLWARGSSTSAKTLYAGTMSNPNDPSTFVADTMVNVASTTYAEYEFLIGTSAASAANAYPAIMMGTAAAASTLYIDDVELMVRPTCLKPQGLAVANRTSSTVTINWNNANSGSTTSLYCIHATDTIHATAAAGDTTYTFTGLTPYTSYSFAARSVCSATDSSRLATTASVYTLRDGHEVTAFSASGTLKRDNVVYDTLNRAVTVPVWYTNSLSSGLTLSWTLSTSAAAFIDTAADGSYTCQVTTTSVKNYLRMNIPLTIRVKAEDRALYSDYTLTLQTESCVADRSLTLNAERIRYTASWSNPDTTVTTHHLINSTVRLDSAALATAQYITVSDTDTYTVEGLDRETKYYVYLKSACDSVWIEDSITTLGLGPCFDLPFADGTVANEYAPVYGYYCDSPYMRSQQIYPASMLTDLVGQTLNSIKYYVSSGSSANWGSGTWTVRMGTTTMADFEDEEFVPVSSLTTVYTGTLNASVANGMTINFSTPFTYTGGNLIISFDLPDEEDYTRCYFYGVSTTNAQSIVGYDDISYETIETTQNFLPKFSIPYCPPANACPEVTAINVDSVGSAAAVLTWTASEADYSVGTQIIVSTTALDSAALATATGTAIAAYAETYTATSLTADQDYYVYIRALCNGTAHNEGMSGWATTTFHTLPICRVPEIAGVIATGKHTAKFGIVNTGTELGQANNFSYIVSTTKLDAAGLAAATPTATGVDTTIVDLSGLLSATKYYIYVQNVCPTENCSSPWSAPDSITMPAAMPAPIMLQTTNVAHNAMTALWVRDIYNFADETAWRVAIKEHGVAPTAADWETVSDTTESGVAYHLFSYLTADTAYDIYVAPYDAATQTTGDTARLDSVRTALFPSACQTIGTGTSTTSSLPFSGLYGFQYSAMLYDIEQTGELSSISFYLNTGNASTGSTMKVWVKTVDANYTLSSASQVFDTLTSGATQIYDGSGDYTTDQVGWINYPIAQPMAVSAGQQLMVIVRTTGCSTSGGCSKQGRYTATSTTGKVWYKNVDRTDISTSTATSGSLSTNRPNLQMCFVPDSCLQVSTIYPMNLEANSVDLMWYPGNAETSWQYFLSCDTTAVNHGTVTTQTITTNSIDATGLLRDTTYYFGIRPICSATDTGAWRVVNFNTPHVDYYYDVTVNADTTMGHAESMVHVLEGTDTALVATANEGYHFVNWTMGSEVLGTNDTLNITVDSNMTITANFAINQYTVVANATPAAAGTVTGAGTVNHGAQATLVATANDGYRFVNWTAGTTVLGTGDTLVLTVVSDTTVAANFEAIPTYTVSVSVNDATMGSVTGAPTAAVREGTTVTLTASATDGNRFVNWTAGTTVLGTETTLSLVVMSDTAITANFETIPSTTYTVHVGVNDAAMGSVSPVGDSVVAEGTVFSATATANDGYHFVNWSNGETNATVTVTVTGDTTLTANFEANSNPGDTVYYNVTVVANDDEMGSVTGSGRYAEGSTVTLSAEADEGYHFVSWSNGATSAVITFTITSDTTFTATFEENDPSVTYYTITGVANDATMGTVLGSGQYEEGATVTLTAMANNGYRFVGWSNGETTATITFVAVEDVTLTATFERITGISDVADDDVKVYSYDNKIVVRGAEGRNVYVFDQSGRVVVREANVGENVEFRMQATGVYLVKVGNAAAKRVLVVR